MDLTQIAALLKPFLDRELTPAQLEQISIYIDLLLRWNSRINLTGIRTPEEILTRHFGESFFLANALFPIRRSLAAAPNPCHPEAGAGSFAFFAKDERTVLDLGSGAGFPALPLKIWDPNLHLKLIESNHKKATFLREVSRALTLTDVDVIAERAETVSLRRPPLRADLVTFRAVEKFDHILPIAASFLSPVGCLGILIGSAQFPKLKSLSDMEWQEVDVPRSQTRVLAIGKRHP